MRIKFHCSGGFGNLRLVYDADTDKLAEEVAQEILGLVESSGFFAIRASDIGETPYGAADLVHYHLTVSDGERHMSVGCNDATTPDKLRPLLTHLRKLALKSSKISQIKYYFKQFFRRFL